MRSTTIQPMAISPNNSWGGPQLSQWQIHRTKKIEKDNKG
uniref:Uncharacterized protein n=1 Tax=Rhizophora mucronata TaxID=61149 RepID=A0A2P2NEN6_RHIMU